LPQLRKILPGFWREAGDEGKHFFRGRLAGDGHI
jgi:hypothetical protein